MKTILLLYLSFITSLVQAQNPYELAILTNANQMAAGLINGDVRSVATYTHPTIVRLMGGADKMEAAMKKSGAGVKMVDVTFGKPSAVIMSGRELQCVVPQRITVQLPQGSLKSNSSLVAFSFDNGRSWVFADTSPGIEKMRKAIPTISPKLVIPARQQR